MDLKGDKSSLWNETLQNMLLSNSCGEDKDGSQNVLCL